jgi:hypothetical protein
MLSKYLITSYFHRKKFFGKVLASQHTIVTRLPNLTEFCRPLSKMPDLGPQDDSRNSAPCRRLLSGIITYCCFLEQQSFESLMGGILSLFHGQSASPDFFSWFRSLVRVGCFATDPNSIVMWSHYARLNGLWHWLATAFVLLLLGLLSGLLLRL